jgi:nucleotide-binding universal stress UspA family protein
MQKIQKIMIAVDFSDYSLPSLRYANALAASLGAGILLVNIYNERDIRAIHRALNVYDAALAERLIEENLATRRQMVTKLAESDKAQQTVVQSIVRVGIPHQALLDIIKEEKPDLVVIGAKGRTNLADTLVGSCARRIFRRSPVPVLMLPANVLAD